MSRYPKTVILYVDGVEQLDVVDYALERNLMLTEAKAILRENMGVGGKAVEFRVVGGRR